MFTEKKINIFDKEKIKIGSFITFCTLTKDYDDGRIIWDNNIPMNGIINVVTETYLEVCTINKTYQIFIHRLFGSPAFDDRAQGDFYNIHGIMPNAIKE
ncbi:hypothetical protein HWC53_gp172 [Bacillus phage vB_BmeM-Goe8]|uniref:Uncharacterized protein n=1 Tax=Bacillus phage vB_BmeM-Goe8 TaxID=2593638 RepID=A0A516KMV9_9CAUD|nr:hypothetical protein HWC53_gp172 [Bacillus phage vB_BmeM-Goe8]QDP42917.1 hypothetical protein Goe8_c01440 [Bacillus phage vB_BmeM-Goe8]